MKRWNRQGNVMLITIYIILMSSILFFSINMFVFISEKKTLSCNNVMLDRIGESNLMLKAVYGENENNYYKSFPVNERYYYRFYYQKTNCIELMFDSSNLSITYTIQIDKTTGQIISKKVNYYYE